MPGSLDYAFVVLFAVLLPVFEHAVFLPRAREAIRTGAPHARSRLYRRVIIGQWALAAAALAIWLGAGRSASALRLVPAGGWRLVAAIVVVGIVGLLAARQAIAVVRASPAQRAALRPRLDAVAFMLPHTNVERDWFLALSATAGFCEELLYRGYLVWLLQPWVGVVGAFAASLVLFGLGHAYQGRTSAIKATLAGVAMSALVIGTGWLVPAMIVHAMIDASAGVLCFAILGEPPVSPQAADDAMDPSSSGSTIRPRE